MTWILLVVPSRRGGARGLFPQSHRHCAKAASQIPRTPRLNERRSPVATTGETPRRTHSVI